MVAGQSCIASPSVYLTFYPTLCYTRLLGRPHFLCNIMGNKKGALQPLPTGGDGLKVPTRVRVYARASGPVQS